MQALALQGAQDTAPSCTSQGPPTPPCDLSLLCPPTPLTPRASSGLERHVCGCETEPQHSGTSRKPGKCPRLVPSWLGDASEGVQPGLSGCRPLPPHAPGRALMFPAVVEEGMWESRTHRPGSAVSWKWMRVPHSASEKGGLGAGVGGGR